MKVSIFTWIFLYFKVTLAREEWIDPHDLNIRSDSRTKIMSTSSENVNFYKERSASYFKKAIGLIVNVARYNTDLERYRGQIKIEMNKEDYEFLKIFISNDELDHSSLRRVDMILENSLQTTNFDDTVMKISEYISFTVFNERTTIFFGLLLLLYILWKIQPHKYTMKSLFKLFFPLVYLSDFVLRYLALIEEVEIDSYLEFKNQSCDSKNLGWIDWFYNKLTGSCQNDEKKLLMSQRAALHIITPMKVFSQQFDIVVPILKYTGQGFGNFMWALIEDVPWYVKPFVALLAFILVIIIILMLGCHILGISPKFNIFHILKIEFLHKEHNIPIERFQHDSISGNNLRLLLESKNNNSDSNTSNSTHQITHGKSVTFKTKRVKPPMHKKIHKLQDMNIKFKVIENDKSIENGTSSSSGMTAD
ncbi:hypothetical protein WA026_023122 [Henosepilachna vigintioctopunctata]|uniref:Chloride channel CLIC-like protein 1 n=1 Tax=Henosepilachna vigintioctopunctata TaxID=420089 RepID=A0AAW1UDH1_9CUCU